MKSATGSASITPPVATSTQTRYESPSCLAADVHSRAMIESPLLAIDVGGTNTKIRLVAPTSESNVLEFEFRVDNRTDLFTVVRDTLSKHAATAPSYCVVSAAGPVTDGCSVSMTNWQRERQISLTDFARAGVSPEHVTIVNDMVVSALGIVARNVTKSGPRNWASCLYSAPNGAASAIGNMVVIMPGTGLGVAGVVHIGHNTQVGYHVVPCELQHASIGYVNEQQKMVARRMQAMLGISRPSWEHFVCGHGLVRVHQMLNESPTPLLEAAEIARRALANSDQSCRDALDLFYLCAGGISQLAALSFLPSGGVYLSGRSSKANEAFILQSNYVSELHNNATHGELLQNFDVFLVTEDTNLDGGIYLARRRLARLAN